MRSKIRGLLIILTAVIIVAAAVVIAYLIIVPRPESVFEEYLLHWQRGQYSQLYQLLDEESRKGTSQAELADIYQNFFDSSGMEVTDVSEGVPVKSTLREAVISFSARLVSPYLGEKELDYQLSFTREGLTTWKMAWDHSLVYPELQAGERFVRRRYLPERGRIYDRNGEPLALKGEAVTVGVKPAGVEDQAELTSQLEEYLGVDPEWVVAQYTRPGVEPEWFVPIKTITLKRYQELNPILRPIPGIFFRKGLQRIYPQGQLAAHLTGYIGEVSQGWIEAHPELDYKVGDLVGKAGLELALESRLRGRLGYTLTVENGEGEKRLLLERKAVQGDDFYLTIDMSKQWAAAEALGDKTGSIVAVAPFTGEVLTIYNNPSYDPNSFSLGMSIEEWQELSGDPDKPLFNRALQGLYPPGSVFKIVTAAAALDTGIVTPETIFTDTGEYLVRGNIIKNYQQEVFGEHTFTEAVTHSINTTFARVGIMLGEERLREYAGKFGFGRPLDFPLPVERSELGSLYSPVQLAWAAVGQSQVLATPFQIARVTSGIAGKGVVPAPVLIKEVVSHLSTETAPVMGAGETTNSATPETAGEQPPEISEEEEGAVSEGLKARDTEVPEVEADEGIKEQLPEPAENREIKTATALTMTALLENVVREGTGKQAGFDDIPLAGKTGTAEINNSSDQTHAWFACFTPEREEEQSLVVFLERGGVGGEAAAPVARRYLEQLLKKEEMPGA